ncbi:MAG TPA: hypothetical protein VFN13_06230 [Rudaea sp.]|nr:hypothetical protein [Rudaea sp.]
MRATNRSTGLAALAALVLCVSAWANFESDYVAGLAALDQGNYAQATAYLKKAIDAQPNPVRSVTINGNRQPYLPHHFLGMAAFRQGDCALARSEWESQMNQRMLGRLNTLRREEDQLIDKCQTSKAARDAAQSSQATNQTATGDTNAKAPVAPPPALIGAYDDYVAARYSKVTRIDPQSFADSRLRFQAYVLRAAARFALSRMGTGGMLNGARSDSREAQALSQSALDARVFSPAFRAFFAASK